LPAFDIGLPYFFRFSGVSGTGPLVVIVLVTEAPDEGSVVVTEVDVAVPVGAAAASVEVVAEVLGATCVVVVLLVAPLALGTLGGCCASAAPPMRAVAAAAVSRCWIFMAWVSVALVGN
jgi:hypothetical protein